MEATLRYPLPLFSDIPYSYSRVGGAAMDAGCYAVHMVRTFCCATLEVAAAQAKPYDGDIDRAMRAELRFPAGKLAGFSARCGPRTR